MLCRDRKLLHLHPPRTGGKSIEDAIFNVRPTRGSSCHKTAQQFVENENVDLGDFYKFMFCRNPWDRVVSMWSWFGQSTGFAPWVNEFAKGLEGLQWSPQASQMEWLPADVDFLGRFENYEEDFSSLCEEIDLVGLRLPHHNTSSINGREFRHKHYLEYYDSKSYKLISEIFRQDIEHFGY